MEELTLDEIAVLMCDVAPETYLQQVISLFISGRATEEHWHALDEAAHAVIPSPYGLHLLQGARRQTASLQHWGTLAEAVLTVSESGEGATVSCIDKAVLEALRKEKS